MVMEGYQGARSSYMPRDKARRTQHPTPQAKSNAVKKLIHFYRVSGTYKSTSAKPKEWQYFYRPCSIEKSYQEIIQDALAAKDHHHQAFSTPAYDFTPQSCCNLLCAMRNFGVSWPSLNRPLQCKIEQLIKFHAFKFNSQDISNSLLALAQMEVTFHNLSDDLQKALINASSREIKGHNEQCISMTLLAFAHMKLTHRDFDPEFVRNLLTCVSNKVANFIGQGIANTVYAMAKMELNFKILDNNLKEKLLSSIIKNLKNFNQQEISITTLSLGQMGMRDNNLKHKALMSSLLKSIHMNLEFYNQQHVANTLLGLYKMGLCFDNFDAQFTIDLLNTIKKKASALNQQGIANILFALCKMQLKIGNFGYILYKRLLQSIKENVAEFNPQNISMTLLSLDQLGLKFSDLRDDLKEKLLHSVSINMIKFNSQDSANTLLAISRMEREHLPVALVQQLLTQMQIKHKEMLEIHKHQIALALTWILAYHQISYPEYNALIGSVSNEENPSRFQIDIFDMLRRIIPKGLIIEEEKPLGICNCLSVDGFIKSKNLIIEVHGPTHYEKDGQLSVKSRQQEELLKKMGYTLVTVNYNEWDSLNNDINHQEQYLRKLMPEIFPSLPFSSQARDTTKLDAHKVEQDLKTL